MHAVLRHRLFFHDAGGEEYPAALAAEGQVAKAIETQKQALQLAPKDTGMQLGLAKLHLKAGDKAAARGLLQELSKLGEGWWWWGG